eukprot:63066_1
MQTVKCVAVGDGAVGKTCMLISYTEDKFPFEYIPTVFDNFSKNLIIDSEKFSLSLWDTAGQEDYDKFRSASYIDTDVFLICFAIDQRMSFQNITQKWVPEIKNYIDSQDSKDRICCILVGTKADLRNDNPEKCVSEAEARSVVDQFSLSDYIECSARTQQGLANVFEQAVRVTIAPEEEKAKCCVVM